MNQKVPKTFVSGLKKQIKQTFTNFQFPSKFNIYFGGGSPNLLSINQLKEIIPEEFILKLLNLSSWSMFVFFLVFAGAKISGLGIKLMKE